MGGSLPGQTAQSSKKVVQPTISKTTYNTYRASFLDCHTATFGSMPAFKIKTVCGRLETDLLLQRLKLLELC